MTKKATKKSSTLKKKPSAVKEPRPGLAFINEANLRRQLVKPDLKRALKMRRHPNDVVDLVALYDAYMAAANSIMGIENQPRAGGVCDVLRAEWNCLLAKAWSTAEHLATVRPAKHCQEEFVRTLVDCAFDMGGNVEDAHSVLRDAMNVELAKD